MSLETTKEQSAAGLFQQRSAESRARKHRHAALQFGDELGGMQVAAGFTHRKENVHGCRRRVDGLPYRVAGEVYDEDGERSIGSFVSNTNLADPRGIFRSSGHENDEQWLN